MGIELKLEVTPAQIMEAYQSSLGDLHLLSLTSSEGEVNQNLLATPMTAVVFAFSRKDPKLNSLILDKIMPIMGEEAYERFQESMDCGATYRKMVNEFLVEPPTQVREGRLAELAGKHHEELAAITEAYNALSVLDANPFAAVKENSRDLVRQQEYWEIGMNGLLKMIITANAMYNPETREELFRNVKDGVVEPEYMEKLIHRVEAATTPKTL